MSITVKSLHDWRRYNSSPRASPLKRLLLSEGALGKSDILNGLKMLRKLKGILVDIGFEGNVLDLQLPQI